MLPYWHSNLIMKTFLTLLILAVVCVVSGCRVKDVRTAELSVPAVTNETNLAAVETALRKLPGGDYFKVISADFTNGTITIEYDSMKVGMMNLTDAISTAGFDSTPLFSTKKK